MKPRTGFTLIEMLVVLGIILVVASLGLLIVAGTTTDQKVRNATELLQAKVLIARMQAVSEQAPRGVRLIQSGDGMAHQLVFIEQAPSISQGNAQVANAPIVAGGNTYNVTFDKLDITGGFTSPDQWRVQAGDSVQFLGPTYPLFTIMEITSTVPDGGGTVSIYVPGTAPAWLPGLNTGNFSIIRANRPLGGEDPINLPDGVGVDVVNTVTGQAMSNIVLAPERYFLSAAAMQALAPPVLSATDYQQLQQIAGGSFTLADLTVVLAQLGLSGDATVIQANTAVLDILFAQTGRILPTSQVAKFPLGRVILWVRDAKAQAPYYTGTARLLVIYSQTGLIAVHDVDRSTVAGVPYANPFSFSQDGLPSGL